MGIELSELATWNCELFLSELSLSTLCIRAGCEIENSARRGCDTENSALAFALPEASSSNGCSFHSSRWSRAEPEKILKEVFFLCFVSGFAEVTPSDAATPYSLRLLLGIRLSISSISPLRSLRRTDTKSAAVGREAGSNRMHASTIRLQLTDADSGTFTFKFPSLIAWMTNFLRCEYSAYGFCPLVKSSHMVIPRDQMSDFTSKRPFFRVSGEVHAHGNLLDCAV
mmetsp:Transcript_30823/g.60314  ORF Transcript_30823/g.60314 Transcript_30823/m.60314 type:complete len:226 (-) Transcript_30823:857-1534(-)